MRAAGKERSAPQTEGARYAAAIFSIALVYEGRQAPVSERKRWRRRKRSARDVGADGGSQIKAWRGSTFVYIQNFCALIYKKLPCQAVYPPFWQEITHMQIYLPVIYKISRNRVYTRFRLILYMAGKLISICTICLELRAEKAENSLAQQLFVY